MIWKLVWTIEGRAVSYIYPSLPIIFASHYSKYNWTEAIAPTRLLAFGTYQDAEDEIKRSVWGSNRPPTRGSESKYQLWEAWTDDTPRLQQWVGMWGSAKMIWSFWEKGEPRVQAPPGTVSVARMKLHQRIA